MQRPTHRGALRRGRAKEFLQPGRVLSQLAAAQPFHHNDGDTFRGGILHAALPGLVFGVHVVVLHLGQHPFVVAVDDLFETIEFIVEGKAQRADAPVGDRLFSPFEHVPFLHPFPVFFAQGVQQIKIDMVSLQFAHLGVEEFIQFGFALHFPDRHLGDQVDFLTVAALERLANESFAGVVVVKVGRIDIVEPIVDGIVQHLRGLRRINAAVFAYRQAHAAKPKYGCFPIQFDKFSILHADLLFVCATLQVTIVSKSRQSDKGEIGGVFVAANSRL